jgi:D-serine deaminase-like pyridoxal phosphate-dependent protein
VDEADRAARLERALAAAPPGVQTPALVIDLDTVEANVAAVIAAAGSVDRWRPHVKTVKQGVIIDVLIDAGVRRFKCATLPELDLLLARADAKSVPIDALIAYPIPVALAPAIAERAHGEHRIAVLADDADHLAELSRHRLALWLDVDIGMHRTGSSADHWRAHGNIGIQGLSGIEGLHGYEGHLGWQDRAPAFAAYDVLVALADAIGDLSAIHTSGSHGFGHALAHPGLAHGPWRHEIGCGTLVLSDVASAAPAASIGVEPAAFVAARVISHPGTDRVTLDAGSKAIAPDRPAPSCRVLAHPELVAGTASEEHLPMTVTGGPAPVRDAILWLVPDHVCTTVNLYREAIYIRGDRFVGTGPIEAAGRAGPWYSPRK